MSGSDKQFGWMRRLKEATLQGAKGSAIGNKIVVDKPNVRREFRPIELPQKAPRSISLPFNTTAIFVDPDFLLYVLGGAWQEGDTGAWTVLAATGPTAGTLVYLIVEQDVDRAITDVSVSITDTTLDPVVIGGSPEVATSNILIAEIEDGQLIQRRHGNFTLSLHQIDGDVVRWADTLVGSIPA